MHSLCQAFLPQILSPGKSRIWLNFSVFCVSSLMFLFSILVLFCQEEEEVENHQQWTERAKKELDDWYNHYNEQLDKTKTENRSAEEQFIEEMTDTKPGNEWEKVSRFCDFNPKNSKNTKDVGRMRSILLQLKQNPLVR